MVIMWGKGCRKIWSDGVESSGSATGLLYVCQGSRFARPSSKIEKFELGGRDKFFLVLSLVSSILPTFLTKSCGLQTRNLALKAALTLHKEKRVPRRKLNFEESTRSYVSFSRSLCVGVGGVWAQTM